MKKKILFIMSSLRNGGAERSLVNLLQLLDYDKYEVDLLLFQEEGMFLQQLPSEVHLVNECNTLHVLFETSKKILLKPQHIGLNIIHLVTTLISRNKAGKGSPSRQYRWVNYYKKIIPELKGNYYDIAISYIHCEPTYFLVDKVKATKKIAWVHIDYSRIKQSREIDLHYFNKLDFVVTISNLCAEALRNEFSTVKDKFLVLPNLTSSKVVKALSEEYYPNEFKPDVLNFVSIGRLHSQKGFDLAIKASHILKESGYKFKWYILGIGELKVELEKIRKKLNVEDYIEFIGARENPYPYMLNADLIIQTSRFEGKSVVLDEAKILCKPIVVTKYTTVYDQISDNEGLIVEINPEAIAEGIKAILPRKDRYTEYLAQNDYGNQEEIKKYYALFNIDK